MTDRRLPHRGCAACLTPTARRPGPRSFGDRLTASSPTAEGGQPHRTVVSLPFLSLPFLHLHVCDVLLCRRQGRLCQAPGLRLGPLFLLGAMSEQTGLALPQSMDRYGEGSAGGEPSGQVCEPPAFPGLRETWGGPLGRGAPAAALAGVRVAMVVGQGLGQWHFV